MKSLVLGSLAAFSVIGGAVPAIAQVTPGSPVPRTGQATPQQTIPQQSVPQQSVPQQTNQQTNGVLRATLEREETLYLDKDKTYDYDLVVSSASAIGNQRLPIGAIVRGRFEPAEGGLVYVANSVEITDRIFPIRATSELLRDRKDPRQTSTGAVLTDAAIGAAGGYILGEVFGRPDLWKVAGGAAAGVLVGNTTAPSVVIVKPEDAIMLFAN